MPRLAWMGCITSCIPCRYLLAILGFIGFIFNYCLRVNINLIITSMVREENSTVDQSKLFDWDSKTRNDIISTFFYGYIVLQLPGGRLAEVIGGKKVLGAALGLTGACTLLIPEAAKLGGYEKEDYPYYLVIIRVLMGFFEGCTFPAMTSMLARWAPFNERALLSTLIMAGSQVGTIVGFFLSGVMVDAIGWEATFYIEGGATFVWLLLWILLIYDTPESHPFISQEELQYIQSNTSVSQKSPPVPWRSIVTSLPVLAILIANVSNNWGFHLLMTELPQYLTEVFPDYMDDSTTAGLWTAIPYASMWACSLVYSFLCDTLIRKKLISVKFGRSFFTAFSQTGPAICLIIMVLTVSNENPRLELTLALFTIAVSMEGGLYPGWITNPQDIAPNFAGSVLGITNAFGAIPGFVAPKIAGILVNDDPSNVKNWTPVWIITCCILVAASILFALLADGKPQHWNDLQNLKKDEEKATDGIKS